MNAPTETTTRVKVLVADAHAVVRRGIRAYLDGLDDVEVVAEAGDGQEVLDRLGAMAVHRELPDVVLIDLLMPRMDGVTTTALIAERFPGVRVVVLTSFGEVERVHTALGNGASGYLLKNADPSEVVAAIRAAKSSPGRKVTATGVSGAIDGAASRSDSTSFAVISSE